MLPKIKETIIDKNWRLAPLIIFIFSIFFFFLFDFILTYITPLIMEERGISVGLIGLIIGSSSVTGAVFDFIFCKIFKNTSFRRILMLMFVICAIYPLILMQSTTIWMFLIAMAIWGIYYDLYAFGVFNFVGKYIQKQEHSSAFGIIQMSRAAADFLAPLIAGFIVSVSINWHIFATSWLFLAVAIGFFVILLIKMKGTQPVGAVEQCHHRKRNVILEIRLWKKIAKTITPSLWVTFYIIFIETFFWTLAPLYIKESNLGWYGGLFLSAFSLPALIIGWFVGNITSKFGKKKTAIVGLLIGSAILAPFAFISNTNIILGVVFLSACFISLSLPAINASYADYICEQPEYDGEFEGIEDLLTNVGWIFGPILGGLIAQIFNIPVAFSLLGVGGVLLAFLLLIFTPKKYYKHE